MGKGLLIWRLRKIKVTQQPLVRCRHPAQLRHARSGVANLPSSDFCWLSLDTMRRLLNREAGRGASPSQESGFYQGFRAAWGHQSVVASRVYRSIMADIRGPRLFAYRRAVISHIRSRPVGG